MPTAAVGSNIIAFPAAEPEPEEVSTGNSESGDAVQGASQFDLDALRALIHDEMHRAVADVERRLGQAREIERSVAMGVPRLGVHAEDLNISRHLLDGYTLTSNSPAAGSIAWSSLHVVYNGVDYTVTDGNTANKYAWFVKPGSGTSVTLTTGNAVPVLGPDDQLLFVNNGGVAVVAAESSVSYAVGAGVVTNAAIADGAVSSAKTDFYSSLNTAITNAQNAADLAQATADGSITTYFQSAAPWATGDATAGGASNPASKVGDVWYDSDDGQAYRWSGAAGSPANTWVAITDSDITTALANANAAQTTANKKIQTFYAASTATPTAESIGDMWIVTDQNNKLRRATAAGTASWVDVQLGDQAISGIGGSKVGSGINASNVTTGTLTGSLVGTGVSATNVTTGTLSGALVGSGVSATNITTGTLAGARVGSGVDASMLTTGTLAAARVGPGVAGAALGSATGTLAGGQVGSGVSASNVTTGTLSGSLVGTGVNATNITTGTLPTAQVPMIGAAKINAAFHLLY